MTRATGERTRSPRRFSGRNASGANADALPPRTWNMPEERCPHCGKPLSHYEDREVRVRWCGFPEAHYWEWKLKVPKLTMRP